MLGFLKAPLDVIDSINCGVIKSQCQDGTPSEASKKNRTVSCTARSVISRLSSWKKAFYIATAASIGPSALTYGAKIVMNIASRSNPMVLPYIKEAKFSVFADIDYGENLQNIIDRMADISIGTADNQLPSVLQQLDAAGKESILKFLPKLKDGKYVATTKNMASNGEVVKAQDTLLRFYKNSAREFSSTYLSRFTKRKKMSKSSKLRSRRINKIYVDEAIRWKGKMQTTIQSPGINFAHKINTLLIDVVIPFMIRLSIIMLGLRITRISTCGASIESILNPSEEFFKAALAGVIGTIVCDLLAWAFAKIVVNLTGLSLLPATLLKYIEPIIEAGIRLLLYTLLIQGLNMYLDYYCCSGKIDSGLCPEITACGGRSPLCDIVETFKALSKIPGIGTLFSALETLIPKNKCCTDQQPCSDNKKCVGNQCVDESTEQKICSSRKKLYECESQSQP